MANLNFAIKLGLAAQGLKQGLNGAKSALADFANNVKGIISGMTGLFGTMGVVAFSRQMIEAGRNFQQSMSQVQAVSGATQEQFKKMSDEAKRLGATTKYSASEAANALENLTRNGMNADDATVALPKTLNLAAAGNLDLAMAADIATNTMNAFKMNANDVGKISDVLAYAAAHSATNVEGLGEAMANVAPIASVNNVSLEETTACLGALANVGIKGAEAGTQLRMTILGLSKPTENQAKAFKELGVNITEQDIKTQGLTANLQKLLDAGILQKSNSNTLISEIFGSRTVTAAASILNNLQAATGMMGELQTKAAGTADNMAKIQMDTLDGDIKSLQSAWEAFNIAVFESKDGILRSITQGLTSAITFARENLSSLGQMIVSIFAAIKLTPLIQSWVTQAETAEARAVTAAQAAATRREQIEQQVVNIKRQLKVQEAALAEAEGAKETAIATKIETLKENLAKKETALKKAQLVEQETAQAAAAAAETTTWSVAWGTIKAAGIACWTTIKAAMISTGIGALIMVVVFAIQKLVTWFASLSEVQYVWGKVCDGCKSAWNWGVKLLNKFDDWYESLGGIGKAVLALLAPFTAVYNIVKKIIGALNADKAKEDEAADSAHNKLEALRKAHYGDGSASTSSDDASTGGGGGKVGMSTGTTHKETPAEKAAKDVKKANEDYKNALEKIKNDTLNSGDAEQKKLDALKSLYNTYVEAYSSTGSKNETYKARMDELANSIQEQKKVIKNNQVKKTVEDAEKAYATANKRAADDILNADKQQESNLSAMQDLYKAYLDAYEATGEAGYLGKMIELQQSITNLSDSMKQAASEKAYAKTMEGINKQKAKGRDTTFDYKMSSNEKVTAQLEFDLDIANQQLQALQEKAKAQGKETIEGLDEAMKNVTSLDEALKLEKVKQDVESLQSQLAEADFSAMQTGWQAVEGTVNNINSLVDTLNDPDASAWEEFASVVNTVMSLIQTFKGVYEAFNAVQQISKQLTDAQTQSTAMQAAQEEIATAVKEGQTAATAADATAKTTAAASNVAAATAETTALRGEAIAGATSSGASMPFPMNIIAIAMGVAAVVAALATAFSKGGIVGYSKGGVPRFAGGGMFGGMTPNGDFGLARVNSGEMILNGAQQNRLFRIANGDNSVHTGTGGSATSTVRGEQLVQVINAYGKRTGRGEILK